MTRSEKNEDLTVREQRCFKILRGCRTCMCAISSFILQDCERHKYHPVYTLKVKKKQDTLLVSMTSQNINRFSKFFHCLTQHKIYILCKIPICMNVIIIIIIIIIFVY